MLNQNRLNDRFCRNAAPGFYNDGNGLNLRVKPTGSRQWVQRLLIHGKPRTLGLGGYPLVSLAKARQVALENRRIAREGGDPLALKNRPGIPTFAKALESVLDIQRETWKDAGKSEKQWRASLRDYAMPRLGNKRVDLVTTADVMAVLVPVWNSKAETARRVRQRIGAIMKWAIAQGYRQDNPAGDAISAALPKNNGVKQHQRALPHGEVAAAIGAVLASNAYEASKLAFEFLVLTAARSGEVRLAKWDEIDLDARTWTVPAERMKAKREHRVPLSERCVEILEAAMQFEDTSGLVFPSVTGRALSDSTLSKLLRENGIKAVPHGFRSSFRDWCGERSGVAREVAEAALAHTVRNNVEAAYARSDLLDKRRPLMDAWAHYLSEQSAKVVKLATG